jgi:hypothetical protein
VVYGTPPDPDELASSAGPFHSWAVRQGALVSPRLEKGIRGGTNVRRKILLGLTSAVVAAISDKLSTPAFFNSLLP